MNTVLLISSKMEELYMKYVDVIGIGAINYDYMFHCKK